MARIPPTSQYAPVAVEPVVDEWSHAPDFVVIEGTGLSDAEREALYQVAGAIERYEPIRASGSLLRLSLRQGTTVLAGRVRSQPLKIMAERLAATAARGRGFASEVISDADLTTAVATALALDARTNLVPVFVETSLGNVMLAGDVPSAEMAAAAVEVASAVPGVASVTSQLVVKAPPAPPTPAETKAEVGATSKPLPETLVTSEPRLEPHSRDQDANRVTRPTDGGERVPVADT